ncbi:MAG TPA: potassium transporter TrkG [Ruminococcus sp.]|nr:potassium transporter TrkG [Ruminococcus sp.]
MKSIFSYTRMIAFGFLAVILMGTLLLSLPIAARSGDRTPLIDCFFTATSATCVTGLTVLDTYMHWSSFGHVIILGLIQIGGLGFMTIITMFSIFTRKHISLYERRLLMQSAGTIRLSGIITMIKRVVIGTFCVEGMGAVFLSLRFCPKLGFAKGLWYAVFHSVSAFCNAGFDLMGRFNEVSLTGYYNDPLVCITLMVLIVIGGLGFLVWSDVIKCRFVFKKMELHSKLVLTVTALLVFGGAAVLFMTEKNGAFKGMTTGEQVLSAFFQSITLRTAGFFTFDQSKLSNSGYILSTLLMFIGGSPGSTAGGVKTTTMAVVFLNLISVARNNDDVVIFKRKINNKVVIQSVAIIGIHILMASIAIFIICYLEPIGLREVIYESVSAISTVGISMGITSDFNVASKLFIAGLMYTGRIGGMTIVLAIAENSHKVKLERPEEKILIG